MIPHIQPDGSMVYMEKQYHGLGEFFDLVTKGAGVVASGTGVAATLFTTAAAAQVIPVIGQIAGAVAIIAGLVARSRAKSKAIRSSIDDIVVQQTEVQKQSYELDRMISEAEMVKGRITSEIQSLGLSGIGDWLQKTFAPARYYGEQQQEASAQLDKLVAEVETKIDYLAQIQSQLQSLYNKLTKGKTTQDLIFYGGLGAIGLTALYFTARHFKWI